MSKMRDIMKHQNTCRHRHDSISLQDYQLPTAIGHPPHNCLHNGSYPVPQYSHHRSCHNPSKSATQSQSKLTAICSSKGKCNVLHPVLLFFSYFMGESTSLHYLETNQFSNPFSKEPIRNGPLQKKSAQRTN